MAILFMFYPFGVRFFVFFAGRGLQLRPKRFNKEFKIIDLKKWHWGRWMGFFFNSYSEIKKTINNLEHYLSTTITY